MCCCVLHRHSRRHGEGETPSEGALYSFKVFWGSFSPAEEKTSPVSAVVQRSSTAPASSTLRQTDHLDSLSYHLPSFAGIPGTFLWEEAPGSSSSGQTEVVLPHEGRLLQSEQETVDHFSWSRSSGSTKTETKANPAAQFPMSASSVSGSLGSAEHRELLPLGQSWLRNAVSGVTRQLQGVVSRWRGKDGIHGGNQDVGNGYRAHSSRHPLSSREERSVISLISVWPRLMRDWLYATQNPDSAYTSRCSRLLRAQMASVSSGSRDRTQTIPSACT